MAAKSFQAAYRFNSRAFRPKAGAKAAAKAAAGADEEEDPSDAYPEGLRAIMAADPTVDPGTYWIEGRGWDLDGINSDSALYVEQPSGPQKRSKGGGKAEATGSVAATAKTAKGKGSDRENGKVKDGKGKNGQWNEGKGKGKRWSKSKAQARNVDNEGRPYDLSRVVVNFNNVGNYYGRKLHHIGTFHWEGVRRCVRYLVEEQGMKVIGVIFENWHGLDDTPGGTTTVLGIPEDIRDMCEQIEETPKINFQEGSKHKSADDEMTIKLAHRRNCRLLDNDNYRDWIQNLKSRPVREWLQHCQDRLQMKYYFDSGLGCFETLDGNEAIDSSEEHAQPQGRGLRKQVIPAVNAVTLGNHPSPSNVGASSAASAAHMAAQESGPPPAIGRAIPLASVPALPPVRPPVALPAEAPLLTTLASTAQSPQGKASRAGLPSRPEPSVVLNPLEERTPLFEAVHQGHLGKLKALLKAGENTNMPDKHGVNAIYYAVAKRDLEAVRMLKKWCGSVRNARGPNGESLLEIAYRWLREEGPETFSREMLAELRIPAGAAALQSQAIALVDDGMAAASSSAEAAARSPPAAAARSPLPASRKRQRTPEVVEIDDDPPTPLPQATSPQPTSKESEAERRDRLLKLSKKVRAVQAEYAEVPLVPPPAPKRPIRDETYKPAESEGAVSSPQPPVQSAVARGGFVMAQDDPYM